MIFWGVWVSDWANLAQIAGNIVLVFTLPAILWQAWAIRLQTQSHRDQAAIDRADAYSKKYDEIKPALDNLKAWHSKMAPDLFLQELAAGGEFINDWNTAMNYFEDMGAHYCQKTLDREFINKTLSRAIKEPWSQFAHVISELRKKSSYPELYDQFEGMALLIP